MDKVLTILYFVVWTMVLDLTIRDLAVNLMLSLQSLVLRVTDDGKQIF